MDIELTKKQSEVLEKELSTKEFWTIKEAKALIESKLGLALPDDQIQELLENKFDKHFSTFRLTKGAILDESGKKESKWRRIDG